MSDADHARLQPLMIERHVERDTVISEPGSRIQTVYFPLGAVFSVVKTMEDGQGCESATVGFESATGLMNTLGDAIAFTRTVVQIPGGCITLPLAQVKSAAAASSDLTGLLAAHIQIVSVFTEQSVACNALHHIESRLCRWLLLSADRSGSDVLPLTQEFLSYMLGVQRTTVTLAARTLQSTGVIRYRRGQLEIIDREGVEDVACECYAHVKQEQQRLSSQHPRRR